MRTDDRVETKDKVQQDNKKKREIERTEERKGE